jgi:hypothetical protein
MRQIKFPAAGVGALAAAALALSACGGGGSPATAATSTSAGASQAGRPGGGLFASLTSSQRSCLARQGVTLPNRPNGRRPNGPPPGGGYGAPGGNPQGRFRNSSRFQKLRTAMQKCGITLPSRPPGGAPGQGGTGTTSN